MLSTKKALTLALLVMSAASCNAMFVAGKNLLTAAAVFGRKTFLNRPVLYTTSGYALGKTAEYFMQYPDTRTPVTQLQNPFNFRHNYVAIRDGLFFAKINIPAALDEVCQHEKSNEVFTTAQATAKSYWDIGREKYNNLFTQNKIVTTEEQKTSDEQ